MAITSDIEWLEVPVAGARSASMSSQRVLIYGMNYSPEIAGVGKYTGEIAELLASHNASVTVVTTPPHYPGWQVTGDYKNAYSSSEDGNLRVLRVPLILRKKMGGIWRLIAPLSFAVTSAPVVFWQILRQRPDVVMCVEPTLFASPVALLAAKMVGARTILHVQDLEVDAAFAVGHLKPNSFLKKIGHAFERLTLGGFDKIVTISNRMADKLAEKNVDRNRLSIIRNWVDLEHIHPLGRPSSYRETLGYGEDDFVVLYSGNIGAKQGLDTLLKAAAQLQDQQDIKFVIAGEGPSKADLESAYGSLPNVRFLPFQPYEKLNEFLNLANLHALTQDRGAADLVLPSKIGGMLASGAAVLVTADEGTELHTFLNDSALVSAPGDCVAMADMILHARLGDCPNRSYRRSELAKVLSKREGCASFLSVVTA